MHYNNMLLFLKRIQMISVLLTDPYSQYGPRLVNVGSLNQLVETLGELDVFIRIHSVGVLVPRCFELTRIHDNE